MAMADARMGVDGIMRVEDPDLDEGVYVVVYGNAEGHGTIEGRFESVLDAVDHVRRMLHDQDVDRIYSNEEFQHHKVIEVRARPGAAGL